MEYITVSDIGVSSLCLIREWHLVCQVREAEVKLLQALSVKLICDLMVEMKKTSYGMQ